MGFAQTMRQIHRWLGVAFTVAANFAVRAWGEPPAWVAYALPPPLFLLPFSGLYLFARPYLATRRNASPRAA